MVQFLVEEALLVKHDIDEIAAEDERQRREAISAAQARMSAKIEKAQGRA